MKLPRDLSGKELAKLLERFDHTINHQTGSHLRLSTSFNGEHHITVPNHDALKVGTLATILKKDVAEHVALSHDELLIALFRK
ncbi:MAG: type II toxin-antitoxin system HicA family toxin [Myxacorys californica WJT36-NPBG1]|jgi:predicted RNA binding protein YcfA (HicA-like mRNA interferase family)|nr:type II toxin-antitoxin system HicA family toxin [Myxacorys californica WJT36-NPBG1]